VLVEPLRRLPEIASTRILRSPDSGLIAPSALP
jgi:hypothetical protein